MNTSVNNLGFNLRITLTMAVLGLTDIVERFGADHTADLPGGCAYIEKVLPGGRLVASCIVGQFFNDLGILRVLLDQNHYGVTIDGTEEYRNLCGLGSDDEFRDKLAKFGVTIDSDAYEFLSAAQREQDAGFGWGDSIERAAADSLGEAPTALGLLTAKVTETV